MARGLLWVQPCFLIVFISLLQSGGFMDMFGMMNDMIGNMVRILSHLLAQSHSCHGWGGAGRCL